MKQRIIAIASIITLVSCNPSADKKMNSTQIEKFESGYAPVNGIQMYYEVHGTGDTPLVLIHGGGSTIETTFGTILPMLAQNRKVIAMDLQAHGRTSDRDSGVTFEQDADDVAALLKHLNVEKADFMGFSNGGNTAMQIAMRHPEVVNKLVIASSFYQREAFFQGFFEGMQHASLANMPMPLQEAYLKVAPDKSHLQAMHDKDKNRMIQFKDWTDDMMRNIKAPTLFVSGDHDVVSTDHQVKMAHLVSGDKLLIVPGSHGSYIGEICSRDSGSKTPEATVTIIEEFLSGKE